MLTLHEYPFKQFKPSSIEPQGWLKNQLKIQGAGLSGNLDKVWPDIKDSQWIGGDKEGWERVPYWLDGFIPLGYLLKDKDMIARGQRYIDYIIENQDEDGWICPVMEEERGRYDLWAHLLVLKVLVVYHNFTEDERVEGVIRKGLISLDRHIDKYTLFDWGGMRWFEGLISIWWLYERSPEPWLLNLVSKLKAQGFDWEGLYEHWPYKGTQENWSQMNHVVNNAMMLKAGILMWRMTGDEKDLKLAERMYETLMTYHGMVTGVFSGDECLAGLSPTQGTELCAVAELMYSFEHLIGGTANPKWGDYLEKVAFNALPATFSPDMWTHQYDQQVNQVQCSVQDNPIFRTNGGESNLFGLEPNFGCCTANLSQPWPKLTLSTFMGNETSIVSTVMCPSTLKTQIKGIAVQVDLETDYPFRDQLVYRIQTEAPVRFSFGFRVPEWSIESELIHRGERQSLKEGYHWIEETFSGDTVLRVSFKRQSELVHRPNNLCALVSGPLVYSLPIKSQWNPIHEQVEGHEFPHCDYEVLPIEEWGYQMLIEEKNINHSVRIEEKPMGNCPFSEEGAPLVAKIKGQKIPWIMEDGVAGQVPLKRWSQEPVEDIELIPYGCTTLRMTELPVKHPKLRR